MAQVSLYVDENLLRRLEERAQAENLSISSWVRRRLEESLKDTWPPGFIAAFGALSHLAEFERPEQPAANLDAPRESFKD